jgi:hypothetical protein
MTTWFSCSSRKAARGQHVKLVFPGGHVELLDRPTLAADVMARHPRFCVARPDVFREPAAAGAVAAPDAVLQLGQKYYVVPCRTVRRLQKYSAASTSTSSSRGGGSSGAAVTLKRHLASERGHKVGGRRWFRCLVGGSGGGAQAQAQSQSQRCREDVDHSGKDETVRTRRKLDVKETNKESGKAPGGGSPGRRRRRGPSPGNSASYSWQPSLHSITEE